MKLHRPESQSQGNHTLEIDQSFSLALPLISFSLPPCSILLLSHSFPSASSFYFLLPLSLSIFIFDISMKFYQKIQWLIYIRKPYFSTLIVSVYRKMETLMVDSDDIKLKISFVLFCVMVEKGFLSTPEVDSQQICNYVIRFEVCIH